MNKYYYIVFKSIFKLDKEESILSCINICEQAINNIDLFTECILLTMTSVILGHQAMLILLLFIAMRGGQINK